MQEVSQTDLDHLKIIRDNVELFIAKCIEKHVSGEAPLLLDVAPQDHSHVSELYKAKGVRRETLDIDPESDATYKLDLCETPPAELANRFDYIQCTEVIEHTLQPFDAVASLFSMLKPGGMCFISVPFDLRIHGPLPDCWRFTEHGLRSLFTNFEIVELDGYENPDRFLMPIHYTLVGKKP